MKRGWCDRSCHRAIMADPTCLTTYEFTAPWYTWIKGTLWLLYPIKRRKSTVVYSANFQRFRCLKTVCHNMSQQLKFHSCCFPLDSPGSFPTVFGNDEATPYFPASRGWRPTLRNVALPSSWPKMKRQVQGWVNIPIPGRPKGTDPILKRV